MSKIERAIDALALAAAAGNTVAQQPSGSPYLFGWAVEGGILLDGANIDDPGGLLPDPVVSYVEYSPGDRVAVSLVGNRPYIMARLGGVEDSTSLWITEQGLENLQDTVVEATGLLEAHANLIERIESDVEETKEAWDRTDELVAGMGGTVEGFGVTVTEALQAAQSAYAARTPVVKIESTRGTAFKNNMVSTDLNVTVFFGDKTITDLPGLWEAFGVGAYLEWMWRRLDDEDFGLVSAADDRLSRGGFTLTVSPDDVDSQTTFRAVLHS